MEQKYLISLTTYIYISSSCTAVVVTVGPASSEPLKVITGIEYPAHIATGRNGEIVVASYMGHKVHVYDLDCKLLQTFGSNGFMDGQFMCPSGIAVDHHNRIFVSSMSKVDVFTMEGQFLTAVGHSGNGPLEFTNAADIAVNKAGNVYVADAQNNRIQVLNSDLTYRTSFSEACKVLGSGHLNQPQAIAINSEGNIYVADMMNHAVQAFTPDGKFILKFGKYGPATTPGAICSPMAITTDGEDNVYVGSATGTISIFDKEGNFLRQFGSYGSELGQFNQIKGMHVDQKGHLYVCEWTSNRIQIFQGSPSMEKSKERNSVSEELSTKTHDLSKPAYLIGPSSSLPLKVLSGIEQSSGIAVAKNGEVIVASWSKHKVFIYSSKEDNYQLIAEVGGEGSLDGKFLYPSGVAVTPDNHILVTSHNKLQWFTMEGNLVHAVGGLGRDKMEFDSPTDVAVGNGGRIYVLDSKNKRVQILNGDGSYCGCFSFPHLTSEKDDPPSALAINSEGSIYFADSKKNCVHVFSSSGEPLFKFGKSGSWIERGTLTSPLAIAIDTEDNVFVGSVMIVSIFDKCGSFIRAFGGPGNDPGQFQLIKGLHIDRNGYLYVSEFSNNRVQIFEGSEASKSSKISEDASDESIPTAFSHKPAYMIGPKSTSPIKVLSNINGSSGVAEGKNGEVVVASKNEHKVFIYNPKDDYEKVVEVGGKGDLDGKFSYPSGIAVTQDNLVLVTSDDKLQWFTMEGKLVYAVGGRGTEEMKFSNPTDVAVGKNEKVYVIDSNNKRVQILNGDGTYCSYFGFPHLTQKKDDAPTALAINSEGNLYFVDSRNNCVHVFSSIGEPLFKFGKSGSWIERGTLNHPTAIAIDAEDDVFVGDNFKISIFDKAGSFIRAFGERGTQPGQFDGIKGMHVGKRGYLYISECSNNRVQILEVNQSSKEHEVPDTCTTILSRRPAYTIGPTSDMPVKILSNIMEPWGITTAPNNDVFIVSKRGKKVLVYNSHDYELKEEIGKIFWEFSRDNEIVDPAGIAICEDGCLLINLKNQLVKITMSGDVIASVGKKGRRGKSDNELDSPNGIAVRRNDGRVYVVDKGNSRIQIFNADLSYNSTCQLPDGQGRSDFEKVAVNSQGNIYVTDNRNSCVHVFDCNGKFLFSFGKKGSSRDRGTISSPVAIAIDHEDYVYISGSNIGVSIFDREGCFVRAFGIRGDEPGEFRDIKAMHIDHKGNLYVCEKSNRVQIFAGIKSQEQGEIDRVTFLEQEETKLTATLPGKVLSKIIQSPRGIAEGKNGEIVVASSSDHKVFVCNHDHTLMVQFGDKGELDGHFITPTGVAVTPDDYILVSSHDKLQWFTMKGQLVYAVGSSGKNEMEFNHPVSIAIDKDGKIYVLDKDNKRVQILNGNGTYHSSFNLKVDHPPEALAINSEGKIFFADTRNNCIQIFSSEGEYLSKFNSMGPREIALPTAIAVNTEDDVYVGTASGIIAVFDKVGHFTHAFRGSGDTSGKFNVIKGLHVGRSGCVYISDFSNSQVRVLGESTATSESNLSLPPKVLPYRPVYTVGPVSPLPVKILSGIKRPSGIVTGPNGEIFIVSYMDNKILIYHSTDSQPHLQITEIKNPRDPRNVRDKRISNPFGLAFTTDGYLLVSFQHQLVKMAMDGTVVAFFGNEKNRNGREVNELNDPGGIAVRKDGRIYLVDRGNHRIQVLESSLEYTNSYFNPDSQERSSEYLECAALNSAGDLYVTDRRNCNIQVFNHNGKFLFTFGKSASRREYKRGRLYNPHAIAIDREDFVYVGGDDGIVSIFDKKGNFVRSFGGSGNQPGQFGYIRGMHIDSQGQLYICEWETNNRVQVFQGQYQ